MLWVCNPKVFVVSVYIFKTRLLLESTQVKVLILQLFNLILQVTRATWRGSNSMHCSGPCRTPTVPFPRSLPKGSNSVSCYLSLSRGSVTWELAGRPLGSLYLTHVSGLWRKLTHANKGLAFEKFLPKLCFLFSKSEEVGAFVLFRLCEPFTVHVSLALTCFLRATVYTLCLV